MENSLTIWHLIYFLPNLLAAVGMFAVASLVWRYRNQRGGFALWLFAVSAFIWAFFESLNFIGLSVEWVRFFWRVEAIGVAVTPLAMMVSVINYFSDGLMLTKRRIGLLAIIPAGLLLTAWIAPLDGLVWQTVTLDESGPLPILKNTVGTMSWIYFSYIALLMCATIGFLLLRFPELQSPQRRQVYRVILAMTLPFLAATFYMQGMTVLPNTTYTTLAFNISGFMLMQGFLRDRLFELPPVTAYEIYRGQKDAVFVLDETNRILDLNMAARKFLSQEADECIGRALSDLLPQVQDVFNAPFQDHESRSEVLLKGHCYDVCLTALRNDAERVSGRLMVWRDVSDRKRLEAELRRLAVTDELTGLYNRRHFFARGEEDIEHARRYGRPLSLIMVDVDHFKAVNDRYGHEAGDRVLETLARVISFRLRNVDCVGRIGGEEFALLMPETTADAACEAGTRLIKAVAETPIDVPGGHVVRLTVSIGIVTLKEDEVSMSMFMRRADVALYEAKVSGRNRLVQRV